MFKVLAILSSICLNVSLLLFSVLGAFSGVNSNWLNNIAFSELVLLNDDIASA